MEAPRRVFVAGGTGAIGRHLVPVLLRDGHEVVVLSRSRERAAPLEALGAEVAVADALDHIALLRSVENARPDAIVHQLTAIPEDARLRKLDRDFALTNRLRTDATDTLLEAARRVGARRVVAQSFCGWTYARTGDAIKTEEDSLEPDPPSAFRETLAAIRHVEEAVREARDLEGVALRYGWFYGPGTGLAEGGGMVDLVMRRRLPIVGDGGGVWSFIHIDDAALATVAALRGGAPGVYNIVDDEPAQVSVWLPVLAEAVEARPPFRIPVWLARLAIGEGGVRMMTENRGAANGKAKRELGWTPTVPSWRVGFREALE